EIEPGLDLADVHRDRLPVPVVLVVPPRHEPPAQVINNLADVQALGAIGIVGEGKHQGVDLGNDHVSRTACSTRRKSSTSSTSSPARATSHAAWTRASAFVIFDRGATTTISPRPLTDTPWLFPISIGIGINHHHT